MEGVVGLLYRPFVDIDAPVLVRFPCCYGATSPTSQNWVKTKKKLQRHNSECVEKSSAQNGTVGSEMAGVAGADQVGKSEGEANPGGSDIWPTP